MATPESIQAKLLGLKNKCTEATGVVDSDLTSAVNRVIDEIDKSYNEGYEQGKSDGEVWSDGYLSGFNEGKAQGEAEVDAILVTVAEGGAF